MIKWFWFGEVSVTVFMGAKFSVLEQTQGLRLHAKFHRNVLIVSASGGQKPHFWATFDNFSLMGPNLVC